MEKFALQSIVGGKPYQALHLFYGSSLLPVGRGNCALHCRAQSTSGMIHKKGDYVGAL
jgi:hypothetical protein